jgi:hypothetical protein
MRDRERDGGGRERERISRGVNHVKMLTDNDFKIVSL